MSLVMINNHRHTYFVIHLPRYLLVAHCSISRHPIADAVSDGEVMYISNRENYESMAVRLGDISTSDHRDLTALYF